MSPRLPRTDDQGHGYAELSKHCSSNPFCRRRSKSMQKSSKRVVHTIKLDCHPKPGARVRCLLKMIEQQQQLHRQLLFSMEAADTQHLEYIRRPRLKSLFSLAKHLDARSNAKLHASSNSISPDVSERDASRLETRLSALSFQD